METNSAGTNAAGQPDGSRNTSFTDIFYYDWRAEEADDFDYFSHDYVFGERYMIFQYITSESLPGFTLAPMVVDVMFQVVTINERKILIQKQLNKHI